MGEKGNGGHVATGGARAVRKATNVGLGGSPASASSGGGILSDIVGGAQDHATDLGEAAVEKAHEHHSDTD